MTVHDFFYIPDKFQKTRLDNGKVARNLTGLEISELLCHPRATKGAHFGTSEMT